MAHEALVSLNLTIESFLNIPKCRNIFLSIPETESVHQEAWSLKSILELDYFKESEILIALKREILETIPKFRDLLQDHINKCLLLFPESQILDGGSRSELIFSQDLEKVKKEMISFAETMKKITEEYSKAKDLETSNVSPLVDPDEALVSLNMITESFLNMPYFNNFHLIRETNLVGSQVWILKSILKLHKERERLNALKGDIVKEIPKFRDLLQDYINKCQLLFSESQSLDDESRSELIFFQDLEKVRKEMISLVKTMKRINKENDFLCGNDEENHEGVLQSKRSGNKQRVTTC
ncbi:hypothetical protein ACJIZ3_009355 [Penstemon smallii]|uniref:Uncharacterized protein n=1 Tax=Penstemon smallii TaxID=265156 RepID=A0ABD3TCB5_9LAMI